MGKYKMRILYTSIPMSYATMKKTNRRDISHQPKRKSRESNRGRISGRFSTVGKYRKTTSYTGSWAESPGTEATLLRPIQSSDQYQHQKTTFSRRPFPYSSFRPDLLTCTRQSDYINELNRRQDICTTRDQNTLVPLENASFEDPAQDDNTASALIT